MLSSKNRFHRRNHVTATLRKGKPVRGRRISLKYVINGNDEPVIAVVVSKKVSKSAVKRNRIRRRIYAAIEQHYKELPNGFRAVFSAFDESLAKCDYSEISTEVRSLLHKIN